MELKRQKANMKLLLIELKQLNMLSKWQIKKDIIILAGKGHEPYQEINGVKHPFDERIIVRDIIEKMGK